MANDNILNIYIANLGKYNEGELKGGWISLPVSEDELNSFLEETVGINGHYEEWAIHDWESDFFTGIGEYDDIYKLNEKAERFEGLNDYELRTLKAAAEVWGNEALEFDLDDLVLYDSVFTDYDLGYYWAEESGCYQLSGPLAQYFDYERFGRDIDLETDGGYSFYGYIEYRG